MGIKSISLNLEDAIPELDTLPRGSVVNWAELGYIWTLIFLFLIVPRFSRRVSWHSQRFNGYGDEYLFPLGRYWSLSFSSLSPPTSTAVWLVCHCFPGCLDLYYFHVLSLWMLTTLAVLISSALLSASQLIFGRIPSYEMPSHMLKM